MKKITIVLSTVLMSAIMLSSCGGVNSKEDISGNSNEVLIGEQVWMTQNLNVDKFLNGDPIPEVKTNEEWIAAAENGQPAWCYYGNDPANGAKYGKLYNWFAVNDPRGLAPEGWHIPSRDEWITLINSLGEGDLVGPKMKSTSGWEENGSGNNSSGFSGLPGGYRDDFNDLDPVGAGGYWWCSTESDANSAVHFYLLHKYNMLIEYDLAKSYGLSVRCIKD